MCVPEDTENVRFPSHRATATSIGLCYLPDLTSNLSIASHLHIVRVLRSFRGAACSLNQRRHGRRVRRCHCPSMIFLLLFPSWCLLPCLVRASPPFPAMRQRSQQHSPRPPLWPDISQTQVRRVQYAVPEETLTSWLSRNGICFSSTQRRDLSWLPT